MTFNFLRHGYLAMRPPFSLPLHCSNSGAAEPVVEATAFSTRNDCEMPRGEVLKRETNYHDAFSNTISGNSLVAPFQICAVGPPPPKANLRADQSRMRLLRSKSKSLHKKFGDLLAVDEVSLKAHAGMIFGLLGPNGAGKLTTIGCISGLLEPTAGRVRVLGNDVVLDQRAAREHLGVVPQEVALYEDLSATENLSFWGAAYDLHGAQLKQRVRQVLVDTGLLDRAKEPVKRFSGGMKRRLNLGCGIIHQPKVLLLDEPTVGVDPQSRVHLLEVIRQQVAQGTCVLYTTHYMEEAETLCDQIAIIDHGQIIAAGTLSELRGLLGERDILRMSGRFDSAHARDTTNHRGSRNRSSR